MCLQLIVNILQIYSSCSIPLPLTFIPLLINTQRTLEFKTNPLLLSTSVLLYIAQCVPKKHGSNDFETFQFYPLYIRIVLILYVSSCLFIYLYTCPLVYLSTCLFVYLSTCLLVYLFTCLLVYLSTCLPVYLSSCLPVFLSSCLPVHLSTCLPVYFYFLFLGFVCLVYGLQIQPEPSYRMVYSIFLTNKNRKLSSTPQCSRRRTY